MGILLAAIVALLIGAVVYLIASVIPFSKPYAGIIGLIVAILVFLTRTSF